MNTRFASILKSLKLPVLSQADLATLQPIQREWECHSNRIAELLPHRIAADQKAAYDAFLEDPTPENEQRLAVLADTQLTAQRHKVLREARIELRLRTNRKAGAILQPLVDRIGKSLNDELERREAHAESLEVRTNTDPRCQEMTWAINHFSTGATALLRGTSPHGGEVSPLEMAAFITPAGKEDAAASA